MASIESQLVAFADHLELMAGPPSAPEAAPGGRIADLFDLLRPMFANISEEEAAAIFAKAREAIKTAMSGRPLVIAFAIFGLVKMVQEAARD